MRSATASGSPIDRYVVLEYLAEGGMGAIYLGKKLGAGGFEKQVVLKQLLPEFTSQPEFIELFLREARLSASLDHANIVHTIDLVTAGEDHFIVMEFLEGADLRSLLRVAKRRRQRMPPSAAIHIAREVLSALAYAHNKLGPDGTPLHLIHRDISPSNILVSRSGEVKLTDFGIAKASTHNSVFYRVRGKVGYMSPEQAQSETLDARSDLYSLAVCLYEMLAGERLFVIAGLTTSAEEMYAQPLPNLAKKVRGLPPGLEEVMARALSLDREERYQTAGAFQDALLRCAHRAGLMISAPELAEQLRLVCGDPADWRGDQREGAAGETGLYASDEGTEQLDDVDERFGKSDISLAFAGVDDLVQEDSRRQMRTRTSLSKLFELRGIELTSMIKISELEQAGAKPLVDFGEARPEVKLSGVRRGPPPVMPPPGPLIPLGQILEVDSVVGGRPLGPSSFDHARSSEQAARLPSSVPSASSDPPSPEVAVPGSDEVARRGFLMRPVRRPRLTLLVILLIGIGTAAAIGLTGPTIPTAEESIVDGAP